LYLADRTSEALETILEAEAIVERSGFREWHAELHRLRGVFLTAIGSDETPIETSFCEAIRIAREQKHLRNSTNTVTQKKESYSIQDRIRTNRLFNTACHQDDYIKVLAILEKISEDVFGRIRLLLMWYSNGLARCQFQKYLRM